MFVWVLLAVEELVEIKNNNNNNETTRKETQCCNEDCFVYGEF